MYRAPDPNRRCLQCGGTSLTPPTKFDPSEGYAHVHFQDVGLLARRFVVNRATICLDCGHVAFALGAKGLADLRRNLHVLSPVPEE